MFLRFKVHKKILPCSVFAPPVPSQIFSILNIHMNLLIYFLALLFSFGSMYILNFFLGFNVSFDLLIIFDIYVFSRRVYKHNGRVDNAER